LAGEGVAVKPIQATDSHVLDEPGVGQATQGVRMDAEQ